MLRCFRHGTLPLVCLLVACGRGPRLLPDELAEPSHLMGLIGKPELAWRSKLPTPPSALLPLGSQVLLITTHRGELYQFNLETGKRDGPIRQPFRKAVTARLVYPEGSCLFLASAQDEKLRAYHLTRGRTYWKLRVSGITGPLALAAGQLVTASIAGEVAAYDTANGHLIWRRQLPGRIYQGVQVVDSLALVLNDSGNLYAFALSTETGRENLHREDYPHLWQRELPVSPNAVMAVGPGRLIIADSHGRLLGIDPASGATAFQIQLDAPIYSQPLVIGRLVVAATAAGEVIALQGSDGFPVWRVQGKGLVKHPLLALNLPSSLDVPSTASPGSPASGHPSGVVLVPFTRGQLLALDLATGRELWRYEMERPIEILSLTPDGIVVVDRRNELFHLRYTNSTTGLQK